MSATWAQIGNDINGFSLEWFGSTISLSDDGSIVASSSSSESDIGRSGVRIYKIGIVNGYK